MNLGELFHQFNVDHPMTPIDGSRMVDNPFTLQTQHKQRWGYVIYRTNYPSVEDWTKFLNMFATWTTSGFPSEDWVVGQTVRDWQKHWWQNDKTNFENASIEALRTHFRSWLAAQDVKSRRITFSEHYMFLAVGHQFLQNIRSQDLEQNHTIRDEEPYIKAYDSEIPMDDPGYAGWMKVAVTSVYNLYHEGMKHDSMRGMRSRYFEWYEDDLLEEETYLVESEFDEN
ncbi:hypothetical protein KCU95_g3128, partial [Aureobasidium melanogenum]